MSYTINLTNGNVFAVIPDGTINSTSSMTLIGKNYAGYGQFLDDNFIHLLENGANGTAPTNPLTGQLWYNTTLGALQVYNGTVFKSLGGATTSSTAPTNNITGDLWFDNVNAQLNMFAGVGNTGANANGWITVGPAYTANIGQTGAIPATVSDGTNTHVVTELYVAGNIVGIVSKDATFTPNPAISGFTSVAPGITLATSIGGQTPVFTGSATTAATIGNIAAANIATLNTNNTFAGNITLSSPYTLNTTGILNAGTSATGNIGALANPFGNVYGSLASFNNILNAGTSATGNIGNVSRPFNTIFAQSTSALYADLAERFAADEVYEAGTVVELGGSAEVTRVTEELSDTVFGVISTRAAYLMNGGAGTDATHPPVAMTGRVPVKVIGSVLKGDRLVSAGNGIARAAQPGEATAFNVIGRALVSKLDTGLGTVEAIVTIK